MTLADDIHSILARYCFKAHPADTDQRMAQALLKLVDKAVDMPPLGIEDAEALALHKRRVLAGCVYP